MRAICPICDMTVEDLEWHYAQKHAYRLPDYHCLCGKKYSLEENLRRHLVEAGGLVRHMHDSIHGVI